jgi:hypothetical protein
VPRRYSLQYQARDELKSLRVVEEKEKEKGIEPYDVRALISMSPRVRHDIEVFCRDNPSESADIVRALRMRDWMLEHL